MSQYPQPPYPQQPPPPPPPPYPYPVPYQAPTLPPYAGPPDRLPGEWSAAGRRAGVLLFVLGGLLLLFGGLNVLSAVLITDAEFRAQAAQQQQMIGGNAPSIPVWVQRTLNVAAGLLVIGFGASFVAAGPGVRRGRRRPTIVAAVVTGVLVAGVGLLVLVMALGALVAPVALAFACLFAIPLALGTLQLVWLVQATRATSQFAAAHQAYAAQYAMYQQSAQPYGYGYGGGYGYGSGFAPPPPPPQLPAQPPPPAGPPQA